MLKLERGVEYVYPGTPGVHYAQHSSTPSHLQQRLRRKPPGRINSREIYLLGLLDEYTRPVVAWRVYPWGYREIVVLDGDSVQLTARSS